MKKFASLDEYEQWEEQEIDHYESCLDNVAEIKHLYELRHCCNVLGMDVVAKERKIPYGQVNRLYHSSLHGSELLLDWEGLSDDRLDATIDMFEKHRLELHERNVRLGNELKKQRKDYAGIGTNKAKRRLNKLAVDNSVANAVRIALEIEDKNILAKQSSRMFRDKIYSVKEKLILTLCEVFAKECWIYGVQTSDNPATTHVIYFEIPGCEQLSWHFSPETKEIADSLPEYEGKWDGKTEMTLNKLEVITRKLLQ